MAGLCDLNDTRCAPFFFRTASLAPVNTPGRPSRRREQMQQARERVPPCYFVTPSNRVPAVISSAFKVLRPITDFVGCSTKSASGVDWHGEVMRTWVALAYLVPSTKRCSLSSR